jgi:Aspartyl protease
MNLHRRLAACCAILAAVALAGCAGGTNGASSGSPHSNGSSSTGAGSSTGPSSNGGTSGRKTKIAGIVQFALPPAGQGCTGARRLAGGARIPVTVSTRQSQTAGIANVCIDGKGPFPFLIDTGAQGSVLTAGLATRLGLPKIGPPVVIGGAGCTARAQVSRITSWNVAGMALQPQFVTYLKIPLFGGRGEPDGLLGSDVWSRFGAMRLDFARGSITVPGPEQPMPARKTTISRPSAAPVPAALLHARPAVIAPMTVTSQPGSTAITVKIRFGTRSPLVFAPDTGASQSAVDPAVARGAGLASAHARVRQGTVCTIAVFPEVRTGPWSVAGLRLRPQVVGVTGLLRTAGVAGLIGSDQMSRFGSVIFDYAGGRLVLGAG